MGNDVDATNGTLTLLYYSEERFKSGKYIHLYYAPLMMCNIFVIGHYQSLRMKPKSIDASNDMSTDLGVSNLSPNIADKSQTNNRSIEERLYSTDDCVSLDGSPSEKSM